MNHLIAAVLASPLALAAPAAPAQTAAKPLTPPDVLGAAKTIQFTVTLFRNDKPKEVSVAYLAQPNKALVQDRNAKTGRIDIVYASDGKTQTEYRRSRRHYTRSSAPASIRDAGTRALALSALADFINPAAFTKLIYGHTGRMRPHEKPLATYDKGFGHDAKGRQTIEDIFIDPATGLPEKVMFLVNPYPLGGDALYDETARIEFTHWKLNALIDDAKFAYKPPATATPYTPPKLPPMNSKLRVNRLRRAACG